MGVKRKTFVFSIHVENVFTNLQNFFQITLLCFLLKIDMSILLEKTQNSVLRNEMNEDDAKKKKKQKKMRTINFFCEEVFKIFFGSENNFKFLAVNIIMKIVLAKHGTCKRKYFFGQMNRDVPVIIENEMRLLLTHKIITFYLRIHD